MTPSSAGSSGEETRIASARAVGLARRVRQRVAEARHRLAAEGQVDVVDAQRVQPRDRREHARGLAHQLGPDAVAGEAGHRPGCRLALMPARPSELGVCSRALCLAPVVPRFDRADAPLLS